MRSVPPGAGSASDPLLELGDRLSRHEFEQRYERMPHLKKAESGDLKTMRAALRAGLASAEHGTFAAEA